MTQKAANIAIINITADQLRAMSDDELRHFCNQNGIATKPGWSKSKMYQALLAGSIAAQNY